MVTSLVLGGECRSARQDTVVYAPKLTYSIHCLELGYCSTSTALLIHCLGADNAKTFGNEIAMCSLLSRENETTNIQMKM